MKNIIISGCNGKMGHVIASCILDRNDCQTVAGIDRVAEQYARFPVYAAAADVKEQADVIIDFGKPIYIDQLDKEDRKSLGTYVGGIIQKRYFELKEEMPVSSPKKALQILEKVQHLCKFHSV